MSALIRFSFLAACLFPAPATANDASYEGDGATVWMTTENRVRMMEEDIDIRFNNAAANDAKQRSWTAHCKFIFKNLTDETIETQIGFPDWNAHSETLASKWAISNFKVTLRGKEVKATHKEVLTAGKKGDKLPGGGNIGYDAAYTWPVTFAPGETLVIENKFSFGGYHSNGPLSDAVGKSLLGAKPVLKRADLFWSSNEAAHRKARIGWDYGNAAYSVIHYITSTGLSWKESIGKARIAIDIPPGIWPHQIIALPYGYTVRDRRLIWEFSNWRPEGEIAVYLIKAFWKHGSDEFVDAPPLFTSLKEAKAWIALARKSKYDRASVQLIRSAYAVWRGQAAPDPTLEAEFKQWKWFAQKRKPTPMTREETAIVKELIAYEKSLPQ